MEREGLENLTANRRIRQLRNCGEIEIPEIPQESPGLALRFDRAKPQTSAFFEHHPLVVVCIGIEQHHADLTRREFRRFFGDTDALATRAGHAEKCFFLITAPARA